LFSPALDQDDQVDDIVNADSGRNQI
jgi:hypothetical protein